MQSASIAAEADYIWSSVLVQSRARCRGRQDKGVARTKGSVSRGSVFSSGQLGSTDWSTASPVIPSTQRRAGIFVALSLILCAHVARNDEAGDAEEETMMVVRGQHDSLAAPYLFAGTRSTQPVNRTENMPDAKTFCPGDCRSALPRPPECPAAESSARTGPRLLSMSARRVDFRLRGAWI